MLFIIVNERKSDGVVFFPGGRATDSKVFDNLDDARIEAKRRASDLSRDYKYIICAVRPLLSFSQEPNILVEEL